MVMLNFTVTMVSCLLETDFRNILGALSPFSTAGFYGAHKFRIDALFLYQVYLVIEFGLRLGIALTYENHRDADKDRFLVLTCFVLLSIYMFLIVWKLQEYVREFSQSSLTQLRAGRFNKQRKYRT